MSYTKQTKRENNISIIVNNHVGVTHLATGISVHQKALNPYQVIGVRVDKAS